MELLESDKVHQLRFYLIKQEILICLALMQILLVKVQTKDYNIGLITSYTTIQSDKSLEQESSSY